MSITFLNNLELNKMKFYQNTNDYEYSPTSSNSSVSSLEDENNYWLRPYKKKHKCQLRTNQLDTELTKIIDITDFKRYNKNVSIILL